MLIYGILTLATILCSMTNAEIYNNLRSKTHHRRVITLSGAGSHGSFENGVVSKLSASGKSYEKIYGISAGAINAVYYSTYDITNSTDLNKASENMYYLWNTLKQDDFYVLNKQLPWNSKSIYDTTPLQNTLTKYMEGKTVKSNINVGATKLSDGLMTIFNDVDVKNNPVTIMLASSSIPILFPPTYMITHDDYFVDGGCFSNIIIPDNKNERDFLEIDAIVSSQIASTIPTEDIEEMHLIDLAHRTIEIASNTYFNHELFKTANCAKPVGIINLYQPQYPINSSMLDFSHSEELYQMGLNVGEPTKYYLC